MSLFLLSIAPVKAPIWLEDDDTDETDKAYAWAYVCGNFDPPDYYWNVQHDYYYDTKGDYELYDDPVISSPPPPSDEAFSDIVVFVKLPGGAPQMGAHACASIS